jgi:hypothetical protein
MFPFLFETPQKNATGGDFHSISPTRWWVHCGYSKAWIKQLFSRPPGDKLVKALLQLEHGNWNFEKLLNCQGLLKQNTSVGLRDNDLTDSTQRFIPSSYKCMLNRSQLYVGTNSSGIPEWLSMTSEIRKFSFNSSGESGFGLYPVQRNQPYT